MLRIYVNTWGNYNVNGADGGEWLTLPMDESILGAELDRIAANMGDDDPEFAIHDFEWEGDIDFTEISEYTNIHEINELVERLDDLHEWELHHIGAYLEAISSDLEEALDEYESTTFYDDMTLEEVAEEIVRECYDLDEFALRYFDFEAFARDLSFDGYMETEFGVITWG